MVPIGGCAYASDSSAPWLVHFLLTLLFAGCKSSFLCLFFSSFLYVLFAASHTSWDKVDLHIQSGYLYFTNNVSNSYYKGIGRGKSDGGYFNLVVSSGIGIKGIPGIAVDWIAGMKKPTYSPFPFITFTTRLMRKNIKGKDKKLLISSHCSFITMSIKAEQRVCHSTKIFLLSKQCCVIKKNKNKPEDLLKMYLKKKHIPRLSQSIYLKP